MDSHRHFPSSIQHFISSFLCPVHQKEEKYTNSKKNVSSIHGLMLLSAEDQRHNVVIILNDILQTGNAGKVVLRGIQRLISFIEKERLIVRWAQMKGLKKGFRYISQIFEEDKEPEIEIGFPTDVKHVAHIGWDGPSVSSPSWMRDFKSEDDFTSSGLTLPEGATRDLHPLKPPSEDSSSRKSQRASESSARELPDLPKASRRHTPYNGTIDSPIRERSKKPPGRHSRKHQSGDESKESSIGQNLYELGEASPARSMPDIPKKSRRKKNKDLIVSGSTRSSRCSSKANATSASCGYASPFSDPGTGATVPGSSIMDDSFSGTSSPNLHPFGRIEEKVKI